MHMQRDSYTKYISISDRIDVTDSYAAVVDKEVAVISDIHLGFEEVLNSYGVSVPPFEAKGNLQKLKNLAENWKLKKIILNGDFKHDFGKNTKSEWNEIGEFIAYIKSYVDEIILIRGNHDNFLKTIAKKHGLDVVDSYEINGISIIHGDKDKGIYENVIIGHEHPSITLRDEIGAEYAMPSYIYYKAENILILPAFSIWTYGTDVLTHEFTSIVLSHVEHDRGEVYGIYEDGVIYMSSIQRLKETMFRMK